MSPKTIKEIMSEFDKITTDEEGLILSGLNLLTVRSFLEDNILSLLDEVEKMVKEKLSFVTKHDYDGNDLSSASNYYDLDFSNWGEVIRYEDGQITAYNKINLILSSLRSE